LEEDLSWVEALTEKFAVLEATFVFVTPDCSEEEAYEELLVPNFLEELA